MRNEEYSRKLEFRQMIMLLIYMGLAALMVYRILSVSTNPETANSISPLNNYLTVILPTFVVICSAPAGVFYTLYLRQGADTRKRLYVLLSWILVLFSGFLIYALGYMYYPPIDLYFAVTGGIFLVALVPPVHLILKNFKIRSANKPA